MRMIAALWLVTGCYSPSASYASCTVRCETDCPPGYACDHGLCRADGAQACTGDAGLEDSGDGADAMIDAAFDAPVPPNACPATYAFLSSTGSAYRFMFGARPWTDAAADCAGQLTGGPFKTHLAVITSDAELSAVSALASNAGGWLGLSDRLTQNTYLWVTTEPTSYPPGSGAPWGTSQPSTGVGNDCVYMVIAELSTQPCAASLAYYCECDTRPNDPSRY